MVSMIWWIKISLKSNCSCSSSSSTLYPSRCLVRSCGTQIQFGMGARDFTAELYCSKKTACTPLCKVMFASPKTRACTDLRLC